MTTANIVGFLDYNNGRLNAVVTRLSRIRKDLLGTFVDKDPSTMPDAPHPGTEAPLEAIVNFETSRTEQTLNQIMDNIAMIEDYVNHATKAKPDAGVSAAKAIV